MTSIKTVVAFIFILIIFQSCSVAYNESIKNSEIGNETTQIDLVLHHNSRYTLLDLSNPVVSYRLTNDNDIYITVQNMPLVKVGSTFSIRVKLLNGNSYGFTEFTVLDNNIKKFELVRDNLVNTNGFTIGNDGTTDSGIIKVHLQTTIPQDYQEYIPVVE